MQTNDGCTLFFVTNLCAYYMNLNHNVYKTTFVSLPRLWPYHRTISLVIAFMCSSP